MAVVLGVFLAQQIRWSVKLEHYSRGLAALETGDLEGSLAELKQAGDYPGAQDLARRTEARLRMAQEAYVAGLEHMASGRWWDAARAFAKVMSVEPRFKDAAELLRRARTRIGYMVITRPYDPHLYIAHTDGMDLRQVPTARQWLNPLGLSKDGATLLAADPTGYRFYLVDTSTGQTQLLFSAAIPYQVRLSPDGSAAVAFPCISTFFSIHPGRVLLLWKDGRTADLLETGECTWAAFAPRADTLVYSVNLGYSRNTGYRSNLYLYHIATGSVRSWLALEEWVVDMRFIGLQTLLLVTYGEGGFKLQKLDMMTGGGQVLATSPRSFDGTLSPKGDVLVYRRRSEPGPSGYYLKDMATGQEAYAFRCCGSVYQLPAFTPDGSRVLYIRPAPLPEEQALYAVRPDGTDAELILEGVSQFLPSHPDSGSE